MIVCQPARPSSTMQMVQHSNWSDDTASYSLSPHQRMHAALKLSRNSALVPLQINILPPCMPYGAYAEEKQPCKLPDRDMAIKDLCSLKTYPSFFFFAQRSLPAVQPARRNIETDKLSQTVEHTGRRRARFSSGCTSLPLLCSCLLADVRYLQTATQLTALLATCCWLSCVHAGQVFAQTGKKNPHTYLYF